MAPGNLNPGEEQLEAQVFSDPAVRDDVLVQCCLDRWKRGEISMHVALLLAVRVLSISNRQLKEQCLKLLMMQPAVYLLSPDGVKEPENNR